MTTRRFFHVRRSRHARRTVRRILCMAMAYESEPVHVYFHA